MPDPHALGLTAKDRKARAAAIKAVSRLPERANGVPNHGDMTQFEEWPDHAIDLLIGGTPCQDYSVAGLRAGMDGVRGSLTLTYAAIARRYRPRWLVWENVFGVLSSKGGRDFASLLGLLSGRRIEVPSDGWKSAGIVEGYGGAYGLAWRVFDTQYVRVDGSPRALPQRRRRVFVVGCFGGDWRRAAAVLFERESLSGNPPP
ncbi:MAG: DNA cytosine methyltransferase, partial [Mesorhizobium sp.]